MNQLTYSSIDTTVDVIVVSMPWIVRSPSIQLGLLKAVLAKNSIAADTQHLYVDFFNLIASRLQGKRLSVDKFEMFGEMLGDWVFSVPPFKALRDDDDDVFTSQRAVKS
jgi:hypothetical protein